MSGPETACAVSWQSVFSYLLVALWHQPAPIHASHREKAGHTPRVRARLTGNLVTRRNHAGHRYRGVTFLWCATPVWNLDDKLRGAYLLSDAARREEIE